jgi:hypothetical protein
LAASDVPVVTVFDPDQQIDELEREQELAKAALGKLKIKQLASMAGDLGLHRSGSREELLDRLLRYLGSDEARIAEMILRYSQDAPGTRRHATRLVRLDRAVELAELSQRLAAYEGSYLRTGIAEWFIFEQARRFDSDLVVAGRLRSYDVEAESLLVEEEGRYGFRTTERDDNVIVRIRSGQPVLRVQARGEHETRSAVAAFCFAAEVARERDLIGTVTVPPGRSAISPQTIWLLSLAKALADDPTVGLDNVSSVSFELQRGGSRPSSPHSPRIDSSRFHGRHVLDTPQISGYIMEGHVVSAIAFASDFEVAGTSHSLTARIAVEDKSVVVATGFGSAGPDVAGRLHNRLERTIAEALAEVPLDDAAIALLLSDIAMRVDADQPEHATTFARVGAGPVEAHPVV